MLKRSRQPIKFFPFNFWSKFELNTEKKARFSLAKANKAINRLSNYRPKAFFDNHVCSYVANNCQIIDFVFFVNVETVKAAHKILSVQFLELI